MRLLLKDSFSKLDISIWGITLLFFIGSGLIMGGNIFNSFLGASGIIVLMFLIGFSIELILSALKNVKGLGTITGFITNGPEALVLIVGLIAGDVLFAASTPLGSNLMNPILLFIGLILVGYLIKVKDFKYKNFFIISFLLTAIFAVIFFFIPEKYYIYWILASFILTIILFLKKYDSPHLELDNHETVLRYYLPLGIIILLFSGYFLDPVVNFTAESSLAPKGLIGFIILATLTSWPEFKSVISLLKRNKILDSFMNILVSNITNLWLAIIGVIVWIIIKTM